MRKSVHPCLLVMLVACNGRSPPAPPPPPAPVAAAAPAPHPVDLHLDGGLEMRRPIRDGRVTVIPIIATASASGDFLTLRDGMARHLVTVRERGEFQVDSVRARNKSDEPVFALTGELIIGGHQDRIIAEDRVIPAHSSVTLAVRCVEQAREHGRAAFRYGGAIAELDLRQIIARRDRALVGVDQNAVWKRVDEINAQLGTTSSTRTYRKAAALQPADRRDRLVGELALAPDRERQVGVAVAIDGEVIAVERFASPALYRALEGELLASYAASDRGPRREGHTILPADVRALAADPNMVDTTDASVVALRPERRAE